MKLGAVFAFLNRATIIGGKKGAVARGAFYKVRVEMVERFGYDIAFLYAVLENASKAWKKDKDGYFTVWLKYLTDKTGWSKPRIIRVRKQLMDLGLLKFVAGKNQNIGGKYKLL